MRFRCSGADAILKGSFSKPRLSSRTRLAHTGGEMISPLIQTLPITIATILKNLIFSLSYRASPMCCCHHVLSSNNIQNLKILSTTPPKLAQASKLRQYCSVLPRCHSFGCTDAGGFNSIPSNPSPQILNQIHQQFAKQVLIAGKTL